MKNNSRHHRSRGESEIRQSSSTILPFISGMGLGAGLMYVLDPDHGNRRRAMAQHKLLCLVRLAGDVVDTLSDGIKSARRPRAGRRGENGDALKKAMESSHPEVRDQAAG